MRQASLYNSLITGFPYRILLCGDFDEALRAYHSALYAYDTKQSPKRPILCKEMRLHYGDDVRSFFVEFVENLAYLRDFYNDTNTLLIAPIYSLLYPLPTQSYCQDLTLSVGKSYNLQDLQELLIRYGYESVEMIEMEGEVSFRGDIIDIYPPLSKPYRISFFDDECEEIASFDLQTQLKIPQTMTQELRIAPALFSLDSSEYAHLLETLESSPFDVMSKDIQSLGLWYLQDRALLPTQYPTILSTQARAQAAEIASIYALDSSKRADGSNAADGFNTQESNIESNSHSIVDSSTDSAADASAYLAQSLLPIVDSIPLVEELESYRDTTDSDVDFRLDRLQGLVTHHSDKRLILIVRSQTELLALPPELTDRANIVESHAIIHILRANELVLSLESSLNPATTPTRKIRPRFALNELNIGEYVVHSDYGIGIFKGIVQNTILGITRDFIHIQYFGDDKLLLPVENLHTIDRYVASTIPVIDRLGKGSFTKLKQKAKEKLFAIADSIIKLAAKRNLLQGQIIDITSPDLEVFKHAAGFSLTTDQESAIQAILRDLASGKVMDRLVSGDVGFGKTEVAMNAMYAVCKSGYQCALIVPTTLLSAQHYETCLKRFGAFHIRIGKCDRYTSTKDKQSLLRALKNGEIDIVIGTHALFGAEFSNLGLVVVDEEHKFGVKQKESLKALSANVHILSMSATPIPRTLNMALSQIKGMSRLETPPFSRKDSRTFIKHKSDTLLQEVITREIRRGGQVFYIYNNIASMPSIFTHLTKLFPKLAIAMLHSQVGAKESEGIMRDFGIGKYHILLCTAIIESGIHLPNANTIIIDGADRFGLADLHQLRGRVGRGDKEGFCYFLIESMESITEEATKRLLALERNSYLGSGASIAYQDLEIRGGGNVIGQSQSGHIKNIGFSLYLKLLEDAISTLSNHAELIENSVELRIQISAYLSPDLITSDTLRLELYRRLSLANEVQEAIAIEAEIRDRFGALDTLSSNFIQLIIIKILANNARIKAISHFGQNIQITQLRVESTMESKPESSTQDSNSLDSNSHSTQHLTTEKKITLKAPTSDDDCVLETILTYLRSIQEKQ